MTKDFKFTKLDDQYQVVLAKAFVPSGVSSDLLRYFFEQGVKAQKALEYLGGPAPVVVVDLNGGLIQDVRSNINVRVITLDQDTEGGDGGNCLGEIEGTECYISDRFVDAGGGVDVDEVIQQVNQHWSNHMSDLLAPEEEPVTEPGALYEP